MIHKLTVWKVAVTRATCPCHSCSPGYYARFLGKPDEDKIAEAIRHSAGECRAEAEKLTNTPDKDGWWVGGGISNGEIAADCLTRAAGLDSLAAAVEAGEAEIKFAPYEIIEADEIHKRAIDILSGEVSPQTVRRINLYPNTQLWLQFATIVFGLTLEQVEEWVREGDPLYWPDCCYIERKLCT